MRILAKGLAAITKTERVRANERKVSEKSEWVRRECRGRKRVQDARTTQTRRRGRTGPKSMKHDCFELICHAHSKSMQLVTVDS